MTINLLRTFFSFSLIFLFFFQTDAFAGDWFNETPMLGVNCGVPKDKNKVFEDKNRCCYQDPATGKIDRNSFNLPLVGRVPIINDALDFFYDKFIQGPFRGIAQTRTEIKIDACLAGAHKTLDDPSDARCACEYDDPAQSSATEYLCHWIPNKKENDECLACVTGRKGSAGIWTGAGCIYINARTFIQENLLKTGVGLAGIVSLFCIIYSAFLIQTSRANPESIKKAQELLTSCIVGLMLIIFSVFLLKLIGVDILKIPGFF